MVSRGRRPEHRRGTTGRPWRTFRARKVKGATNCARCGVPLLTNAQCQHPTHARLKGCPTHPQYPTIQHPDALKRGGAVRDDANAEVWCFHCNSSEGATIRDTHPTLLEW